MLKLIFSSLILSSFVLYGQVKSDTLLIAQHLRTITKTEQARNALNVEALNKVAEYIHSNFKQQCDTVFYQEYEVEGEVYKNVIGRMGPEDAPKIVVGAHYDVCGDQEGADDNATGVVGLLELSRMLNKDSLDVQIEFVAYTLEEPPFFRSQYMGSYVHAKSIYDYEEPTIGMVCLEMIGYFSDEKKSQRYPIGLLKMFYGGKGDYITVVQKFGNGKFGRKFNKDMKKQKLLPTKSFKGPAGLQGIDFSDHLNYWKFDYSAVMITNTAFYRNSNYHKNTDTMETLDLNRMALVIDEVYLTLKNWKLK
ncbi:M28 family peptidase [Paracrocinitomix mangrovi]|uniref:M28 family peptidase n=1 Tax=Paracrocinitomix mangrovi TaxID=2862509 RepID=UPI001C8D3133|nr:M28 family peptidase [Paracrocinitomix mangrovi]UKN02067.1 M28 family peptidase [Paracrocinitomix mangrovi]